jgi:hypothetical protein
MPRVCILFALLSSAALAATAVTVEDGRVVGELVALDATPAVTLSVEEASKRIACSELLSLELREGRPSPQPGQALLVLRNGDRLCGALTGGTPTAVELRGGAFGALACPIAAIARLHVVPPGTSPEPAPAENADRLRFVNGDSVDGTVEAFGPKGVTFRSEHLGALELEFARIRTVSFARGAGERPPRPEGVHAIVHCDDGTAVTGSPLGIQEGRLHLKTAIGLDLDLDLARVLRLDFRGGRLTFLSDMEPSSVVETPCFDVVWAHRRDLSVDGNPLRLGDREYTKGLGVHSRCEISYALGGRHTRFLAHVGIDEEVGDRGNAHVQVLVDGEVKFERKALRGRDAPVPVALDVAGAKVLTLRVDFGEELDICDHVDWAAARLIR